MLNRISAYIDSNSVKSLLKFPSINIVSMGFINYISFLISVPQTKLSKKGYETLFAPL